MENNEVQRLEQQEPWQTAPAPEDAEDAKELGAMDEAELNAELEEEMGPVGRWMQDNVGAAEFANSLYPDLLDIDDAQLAVRENAPAEADEAAASEIDTTGGA